MQLATVEEVNDAENQKENIHQEGDPIIREENEDQEY